MPGPLRIVADENIPQAAESFAALGPVRLVDGRAVSRDDLREADALVVRSVTRVNEALLAGTPVRFVGTATIGTDHVDAAYLQRAGIGFASAKGCNARSVAEYIVAALLEIAAARGIDLAGRTLGIVGHGNIGSIVARFAEALGLRVLACDPPLQRARVPGRWCSLDTVLRAADFVTLHVPLNREGVDRTVRMIGAEQLAAMKRDAWLVNTSRGEVVRGADLAEALDGRVIGGAVLDVWENEPAISRELLGRVRIATPHIAGYSIDGKLNGTRMMVEASCRHFGVASAWTPVLPPPTERIIRAKGEGGRAEEVIRQAVLHAYDLLADDSRLREGPGPGEKEFARHFDRLRREYPVRHEFGHYTVEAEGLREEESEALAAIGFRVRSAPGGDARAGN